MLYLILRRMVFENIYIQERVKGSCFENVPEHDSDIDLGSEDEVDNLRIAINVNEAEQIVYE